MTKMNLTPLGGRIYQFIPGFETHLRAELKDAGEALSPSLYYLKNTGEQAYWAQNIWLEPFELCFDSISEAAKTLVSIQRNWSGIFHTQFRRAALIQDQLPALPSRPRPFPWHLPDTPMGGWTLIDKNTIVASAITSSPFASGVIEFEEDKLGPPSRAYLKLWEAFIRARAWPKPGERCIDAGASPGGWTWALSSLGAQVLAIDRAPLEKSIAGLPGVSYLKHDAFTLKPESLGKTDWLFSDVISYPDRLFGWIEQWLQSGLCKNFICTVKMQGNAAISAQGDSHVLAATRLFASIPGSVLLHLYHNKHELTWIKIGENPL